MLTPGTHLGSYRIEGLLGAGGMGEVYRARDTKLGRTVALKILPARFADDADRLSRFQREAQLLASLNHAHIAAIYGLEDTDSVRALVLEFVEGPTLADRIMQGPLSLGDALHVAVQICEALEAAHSQGIIHRDLKPANIKLRPDGTVKVLDFGLAKLDASGGESDANRAHSATVASTEAGIILGTAAYMSPEQARGQGVDKRTDVWAFGCVLYEMLTARTAFARDTTTDTIVAIIDREPDWSALPPATPQAVRRLLKRCLEKDASRRLRDIGDARLELDDARAGSVVDSKAAPGKGSSRAGLTAAVVIAVISAASAMALLLNRSSSSDGPNFPRIVRLTSGPDKEVGPVISPDGKWVAYVSNAGGPANVWVKFLSGGGAVNLTASTDLEVSSGTGIGGLEISPDGSRIAVMARPRGSSAAFSTWELPAPLPGLPRKVLGENLLGMRWSPDGQRITYIAAGAAAGDGLFISDADGSNQVALINPHNGMHIHWPAWGSDGYIYFIRTFATVVNLDASEIYRIDIRGNKPMEPVVQTLRRAQFPLPLAARNGIIYSANAATSEMRLWWSSLDGTVRRQLTSGVGEYAEPRASADGRMLVCTLYDLRQALIRIALTPKAAVSSVTDGYHGDLDPMVSPSGDRIVFSSSRDGNRHVWTARLDGSDPRPLTSGATEDDRPVYSPDGRQIAFASDRGGTRGLWVMPSDGGLARKVADASLGSGLTWSRDGQFIVYSADAGEGPGLWKIAVAGGQPQRIPTPFFASEPSWSPAGDVIAFVSVRRIGNIAFSNVGFVDPAGKSLYPQLPDAPGGNGFSNGMVAWSPDGRRVAVIQQQSNSGAQVWLVDPQSARPYTMVHELPLGARIRGVTWTRDGGSLVVGQHDWSSDIVLMDQGS